MRVHVVTIFPEFFESALKCSILRIAQEKQALQVDLVNLRDFTRDSYRTVDDYPFGGGPGMVMKPEPVFEAVRMVQGVRGSGDQAGAPVPQNPGSRFAEAPASTPEPRTPPLGPYCSRPGAGS